MIEFFNKRFFILYIFPLFLGSITVFGFQPFNFFFINFLSFGCLFFLIVYVKKGSKSVYRKKPFLKNLFFLGTSFGFGFYLSGIHWIVQSLTFDESFKLLIPIGLIIIPLFLSLFFSMPIILIGSYMDKNISSIILLSLAFAISDFLRATIFSGFPWNLWAYSFSWSLESLQILSLFGLFSFNFLVILIFFVPTVFFIKNNFKYIFISFFIIIFFSNFFYGSYKINSFKKNDENKVNFKIVSASLPLSEFIQKDRVLQKLIKFSSPEKDKKTIFIWPEGIFFGEEFNEIKNFKNIFQKNFSNNHLIIFGINTSEKNDNKIDYFNSLVVVDRNLNLISKYDKKKLVPFGEFLPFENILNKIGLKKITPGYSSFSKGIANPIIELEFDKNNLNFLALICYEIIFPNMVEINKNKFNFIVNISEDAWFGNSIGPKQHFSKAIFRSIESGVYTIRSANKGISAFISPTGEILKSLGPKEAGNIEMKLSILKTNKYTPKKSLIFFLLLITFISTFFVFRKFKI